MRLILKMLITKMIGINSMKKSFVKKRREQKMNTQAQYLRNLSLITYHYNHSLKKKINYLNSKRGNYYCSNIKKEKN